jgi:hypothetical protein
MSVTLHTSLGDIKIEVFCESVPKTAEVPLSLQLEEEKLIGKPRTFLLYARLGTTMARRSIGLSPPL